MIEVAARNSWRVCLAALCGVMLVFLSLDAGHTVQAAKPGRAAAGVLQTGHTTAFLPWVGNSAGAEVRVVGRLGGTTRALVARGRLVYAAIDHRVVAFEDSPDASLRGRAESFAASADLVALAMADTELFAADMAGTVYAFSILDPEDLVLVAARDFGGHVRGLTTAGPHLVVAVESGPHAGLLVLNAAPGGRLQPLSTLDTPQPVVALAATDSLVTAVTSDDRLLLVDTAVPDGPAIVGQTELPVVGSTSVAVDEGVAVVANATGIVVIDVADPRQLQVRAEQDLAGSAGGVAVSGAVAYVATDAGLAVVSVSDPAQPTLLAIMPVAGGLQAVAVESAARLAFGGGAATQAIAWDVSDPGRAARRGSQAALGDVVDVTVARDGLFAVTNDPPTVAMVVGGGAPLQVADTVPYTRITEPIEPLEVALAARQYYGFVLLYDSLTSYDTSTPSRIEARRLSSQPWAGGMVLAGDYLFVARDGLVVVDASRASELPEVGHYKIPSGTGKAVAVAGSVAYLAQRSARAPNNPTDLWVFDVAEPRSPVPIGTYEGIAEPYGLAAVDGFVYVSGTGGDARGLWLYDASDPARIHPSGATPLYPTVGLPRTVVRDGDRVYLVEEGVVDPYRGTMTGRHGVHVLDVRDPSHPAAIAFVPFPAPVGGIAAVSGRLYVAARHAGIVVMEVGSPR